MYFTLLPFLGILSISLAASFGPVLNQYATPQILLPDNSFNFNPYIPSAVIPQPVFPQFSSFNPPQEQNAGSVPRKFKAYLAPGVFDNDPVPSPVQQPAFPRVFPQADQATDTGKSHFTDLVRTFATNFVQRIQASPVYRQAFALHSVSREEATKLFKDYVKTLNEENGDRDAEFSSYTVSQAVKNNYDSTSNLKFSEIHAYAAGELLYQTGQLTAENCLRLSNEYYQDTANAVDAVTVDTPVEKLRAAMDAFAKFLADNNVYKTLAFAVSSVFHQVFYTLGNN